MIPLRCWRTRHSHAGLWLARYRLSCRYQFPLIPAVITVVAAILIIVVAGLLMLPARGTCHPVTAARYVHLACSMPSSYPGSKVNPLTRREASPTKASRRLPSNATAAAHTGWTSTGA